MRQEELPVAVGHGLAMRASATVEDVMAELVGERGERVVLRGLRPLSVRLVHVLYVRRSAVALHPDTDEAGREVAERQNADAAARETAVCVPWFAAYTEPLDV